MFRRNTGIISTRSGPPDRAPGPKLKELVYDIHRSERLETTEQKGRTCTECGQ
jgi:hypothetical protein